MQGKSGRAALISAVLVLFGLTGAINTAPTAARQPRHRNPRGAGSRGTPTRRARVLGNSIRRAAFRKSALAPTRVTFTVEDDFRSDSHGAVVPAIAGRRPDYSSC
jgi:hypothetical protein